MKVKVEGTTLERDVYSKSLIETNTSKQTEYLARRAKLQKKFADKDERIAHLENEIGALWDAINKMNPRT